METSRATTLSIKFIGNLGEELEYDNSLDRDTWNIALNNIKPQGLE
jgi:hypothetical protein